MRRNRGWRQQFAAKFDQLGRRLGGGPVVGMHGAFIALPFTTPTSKDRDAMADDFGRRREGEQRERSDGP